MEVSRFACTLRGRLDVLACDLKYWHPNWHPTDQDE
jgi:hypothetical protein